MNTFFLLFLLNLTPGDPRNLCAKRGSINISGFKKVVWPKYFKRHKCVFLQRRNAGRFFLKQQCKQQITKPFYKLREDVSIHRKNLKYCGNSNNCGVVFFVKIYFSYRVIIFFVRPLKYANFHREYYPSCVTSCNEYTWPPVFCQHNPLLYHLNLIPCHYWSWQRNISFSVNISVRHTFSISKSSKKKKNSCNSDRYDRIYWISSF